MPTYEYERLDQGHHFEEFQNITEAPLTSCPECGGQVRRLISGGAGFLFRGSGFYQTDYRSESYRKAEKAERSAVTSSAASESGDSVPTSGSSSKKSDSAGKNGRSGGSGT